ncbi:MAG: ABC-2 type transport system ATP-binding protein [Saprospiraceae bacterium]|jgi:ABC-2 type transport system ATP-binding protein
MTVLQINKILKTYGRITAVSNLNLKVQEGDVYGILGPNGSGKTTTLGIILGIIRMDEGDFTWFDGKYGNKARLRIGTLLETPNFYPYMDADQNLEVVAHIKGVKKPVFDDLLELVNLKHRRKSPFRTYSLGMKQRLAIASAMVGDPEVLIFDEPTNGLDPQGIAEVRETIREIAARGKTIIMASHILDEVEKICSHVAIIKNGNLLADGKIGSIINNEVKTEISSDQNVNLKIMLQGLLWVKSMEESNGRFEVILEEGKTAADINKAAFEKGITLHHLLSRKRSLETEFLEITKNQ